MTDYLKLYLGIDIDDRCYLSDFYGMIVYDAKDSRSDIGRYLQLETKEMM